jgi:hypothetical protein
MKRAGLSLKSTWAASVKDGGASGSVDGDVTTTSGGSTDGKEGSAAFSAAAAEGRRGKQASLVKVE